MREMDARAVFSTVDEAPEDQAAFSLVARDPPPTPLVFASPHSGRCYPAEMLAAAAVGPEALRQSEDAFVDEMIAPAADAGAAVITARYGRAFMDLNRDPWELDPSMFSDVLPPFAQGRTARVAAGLGAIARTAGRRARDLRPQTTFAEARARVAKAHAPYHDALDRLLARPAPPTAWRC